MQSISRGVMVKQMEGKSPHAEYPDVAAHFLEAMGRSGDGCRRFPDRPHEFDTQAETLFRLEGRVTILLQSLLFKNHLHFAWLRDSRTKR